MDECLSDASTGSREATVTQFLLKEPTTHSHTSNMRAMNETFKEIHHFGGGVIGCVSMAADSLNLATIFSVDLSTILLLDP